MPRRKLTEKEKADRKAKQEAERIQRCLDGELEDLRWAIKYCFPNRKPTINFKVGQRVSIGAIEHIVVREVLDGGLIYKLEVLNTRNKYIEKYMYRGWYNINFYRTEEDNEIIPVFTQEDDLFVSYSQRTVSGLFTEFYHFGIDLEPDYQRGNVWKLGDKISLLDSIFNNIGIGKFVIIKLPFKSDAPSYEMLDGKQRLLALVDFYENRYRYNGKYFMDLSWRDRNHFYNYNISYGEVKNPTQEQKYRYFLKLNTGGKPVDPKHLKHVKNLWEKAK